MPTRKNRKQINELTSKYLTDGKLLDYANDATLTENKCKKKFTFLVNKLMIL